MPRDAPRVPRDPLTQAFGAYVRSQRMLARLSLRQAAALARISNPYLSQIEHGLARPSVSVITALAEALQVSADTLLLRAAGVPADGGRGPAVTEDAIRADPRLADAQKTALLSVLASFVGPQAAGREGAAGPHGQAGGPQRQAAGPQRQAARRGPQVPGRTDHPDGDRAAAPSRTPRRRRPPPVTPQDGETRDSA